jgi:hypothetical protein
MGMLRVLLILGFLGFVVVAVSLGSCGFGGESVIQNPRNSQTVLGSLISPEISGVERQKVQAAIMRLPARIRNLFTKDTAFFLIESDDARGTNARVYVNRAELRGALKEYVALAGHPGVVVAQDGDRVAVPNFPAPSMNSGRLPELPTIAGGYERRLIAKPASTEFTGFLPYLFVRFDYFAFSDCINGKPCVEF